MRGDGGVAGEGRVARVPKFHSWGKWIISLMNINSDWMSNASGCWDAGVRCQGIVIIPKYLFILYYKVVYFASWGITSCVCRKFLHNEC